MKERPFNPYLRRNRPRLPTIALRALRASFGPFKMVMLCHVMLCYVMLCYVFRAAAGGRHVAWPKRESFANFFFAQRANREISRKSAHVPGLGLAISAAGPEGRMLLL